jgi:guanylate kinase
VLYTCTNRAMLSPLNGLLLVSRLDGPTAEIANGLVDKALAAGRDVLFDIDWQGTRQLLDKMRDDVVTVFVLPPSADELKSRLERRAEDSGAIIAQRLLNAVEEISHWREYDYILVNRDLDKSFLRVRAILTAERLKRVKMLDLEGFVDRLLAGLKKLGA